ncbi:ADP-ribose 1''-phosphate phosphatase [Cladophialophora chaetospira]|uniref:ADP-ribose 1''-phosphate phosphatase n=1 Tax=Cladophialophora chaetospira TaxID=386627 RepID=A0AA38X391_9EURO|nr:ADP-ribose 1''-phosphate phosphatase [Cladophialophora chaetospira]
MDPIHSNEYHKRLSLPEDATLEELDERYFEVVEYWTVQERAGVKDAKRELQRIYEAYGVLLKRHMKEQDVKKNSNESNITMQQIVTGQDRFTRSSMRDADLWVPPRPERARSLELQGGIDLDGMDLDEAQENDDNLGTVPGFSIREIDGDVKNAPDRAVIVHAVNCQGVWGYGIAKELKKMCPVAYEIYRAYCQQAKRPADIVGHCLLIPPQPSDYQRKRKLKLKGAKNSVHSDVTIPLPRRWIACLFTSIGYGKPNMKANNPGKDIPPNILSYTREALEDLRLRLEEFCPSNFNKKTRRETDDDRPGEIWSPKFNSGAFGVEWDATRELVVEEFDSFERGWVIVNKVNTEDYEPDHANQSEEDEGRVTRVERAVRQRRSHSKIEFEDLAEGLNDEPETDQHASLRDTLRKLDFQ